MIHSTINLNTTGQGLYEFTDKIKNFVSKNFVGSSGLITLFVRHTSCSLIIQENADRDVQLDLQDFFAKIAPENMPGLRHTCEGPDDMPAHIKAALNQVSITIPIVEGTMVLGTWQGIYLFEHRSAPHQRMVTAMLTGS